MTTRAHGSNPALGGRRQIKPHTFSPWHGASGCRLLHTSSMAENAEEAKALPRTRLWELHKQLKALASPWRLTVPRHAPPTSGCAFNLGKTIGGFGGNALPGDADIYDGREHPVCQHGAGTPNPNPAAPRCSTSALRGRVQDLALDDLSRRSAFRGQIYLFTYLQAPAAWATNTAFQQGSYFSHVHASPCRRRHPPRPTPRSGPGCFCKRAALNSAAQQVAHGSPPFARYRICTLVAASMWSCIVLTAAKNCGSACLSGKDSRCHPGTSGFVARPCRNDQGGILAKAILNSPLA